MSRNNPLISVIMAVYNGERYIVEALQSVLRQEYAPLEILVMDDASTDRTAALVQELAATTPSVIHYHLLSKRGQYACQNYGIQIARGEFVTFLDHDDLYPPERFPAQVALLARPVEPPAEAPVIVLGRQQRFPDEGATVDPVELARFNARPNHYSMGSSLFRRSVFDQVGLLDVERFSADWEWFIRAKNMGIPIATGPQTTLHARIHTDNVTRQRKEGHSDLFHLLRIHMAQGQHEDNERS